MADQQAQPTRQLVLQKIYIKDFSFESPKAPDVFRQTAAANTQLNLRTGRNALPDNNVEVTLTLTVESKANDETIFLIELVQAGVFMIDGYNEEEQAALEGSFCPATLYPFAREAIADMATKGGFPPLLLQPINFDALYMQAKQERAAQAGATTVTTDAANAAADVTPQTPPAEPQGSGGTH